MKATSPVQERLVLILALLTATFLRFTLLGDKSLWADEATSIAIAGTKWWDFGAVTMRSELNMAFYHLLLFPWLRVGSSESWIRGLSVMFSLATLPMLYGLAKQLIGRQAARLALLLTAVHAVHVQYAQEARGYSLVVLLVTASWWLFVQCAQRPGFWNVISYTIINVLLAYTHFYGMLVPPAQMIVLILVRRPGAWPCVASISVALLCFVPIAFFLATRNSGQGDWIREQKTLNLPGILYALTGSFYEAHQAWAHILPAAYCVSITCACALSGRCSHDDQPSLLILLVGFCVPLGLAICAAMVNPLFLPRYLLICLPPFVLLAALGLSQFSKGLRTCVLGTILLTSFCADHYYYSTVTKEAWRSACELLIGQARHGDTIILYAPLARWPFEYYVRRDGRSDLLSLVSYPRWNALFEVNGEYAYSRHFPMPDNALTDLVAARYERVWLVLSHDGFEKLGRAAVSRSLQGRLNLHFGAPREVQLDGVRILLYQRHAPASEAPLNHCTQ
jgi:mannosyltransferase